MDKMLIFSQNKTTKNEKKLDFFFKHDEIT